MTRQYLAVITIADGYGFNQLRDEAATFLTEVPDWVESIRISEATSYQIQRDDSPTSTQ